MMPWAVDPAHTALEFSAKHLGVMTVRGRFDRFDASVKVEDGRPLEAVATIDTASVSTRETKRDDHLRSADFFDVEKFPKMTFKSTRIETNGSRISMDGDLTIRDVTRPIHLEGEFAGGVKDPWGGERLALSMSGKVNRKDWGLQWNVPVGERLLVSDDVTLHVDTEIVHQDAAGQESA